MEEPERPQRNNHCGRSNTWRTTFSSPHTRTATASSTPSSWTQTTRRWLMDTSPTPLKSQNRHKLGMPDKSERVLVKMLLHITWHFLFSRFQSVAMMRKAPIGHCRTRIIPRASVIRCDAATMTYGIHTAGFPQQSHHGFGPNGITRGLERQPWTMYKNTIMQTVRMYLHHHHAKYRHSCD